MADQLQFRTRSGGIVAWLGRFPWTFLVVLYPVVMYFSDIDMTGRLPFGLVYVGVGVFVLFVEFFKSGDINTASFLLDLLWAVLAVVAAAALMTWFLLNHPERINYFHWFGCAIVLGDAIISPFNSFRTALRNLGLGTSV